MLSADAKSAVLLRVLSLTLNYAIYRCCIFQNGSVWVMGNLLYLCDVCKCWSWKNVNVSVSSILNNGLFYLKYYFLRHRNSPSKRFIWVSVAKTLFSIFIPGLNIYSVLEELPKVLFKIFLFDVDRLTLPRHPQDVIFEHIF